MGNGNVKNKLNVAPQQAQSGPVYIVLTGLNYNVTEEDPAGKRVEIGAEVSDLPAESIPWLLQQGHIVLKQEAVNE